MPEIERSRKMGKERDETDIYEQLDCKSIIFAHKSFKRKTEKPKLTYCKSQG